MFTVWLARDHIYIPSSSYVNVLEEINRSQWTLREFQALKTLNIIWLENCLEHLVEKKQWMSEGDRRRLINFSLVDIATSTTSRPTNAVHMQAFFIKFVESVHNQVNAFFLLAWFATYFWLSPDSTNNIKTSRFTRIILKILPMLNCS